MITGGCVGGAVGGEACGFPFADLVAEVAWFEAGLIEADMLLRVNRARRTSLAMDSWSPRSAMEKEPG